MMTQIVLDPSTVSIAAAVTYLVYACMGIIVLGITRALTR